MKLPAPTLKRRGPSRDRRGWLEREAYELSKHCPVDESNPKDCPLCRLRPLSAEERKTWIHELTDDELEYLVSYHSCCCAVRMALVDA